MEKAGGREVTAVAVVVATLLLLPPPHGAAVPPAAAATGQEGSCTRSCGNISVPYPFGVEPGCYHAAGFNLTCRGSGSPGHGGPPELFLGDGTVPVLEISVQHSTVRINNTRVDWERHDATSITMNRTWGGSLPRNGPFFLSESVENMFVVLGCDITVSITGGMYNNLPSSCTSICPQMSTNPHSFLPENYGRCMGSVCCQANTLVGYSFYNIQIKTVPFGTTHIPNTVSIYIADQGFRYSFDMIFDIGRRRPKALPATLDFLISNSSCPTNTSAPECRSSHSYCKDSTANGHGGYTCQCSDGYNGNAYVVGGCLDIDECKFPDTYACYSNCENTPGSFICKCYNCFRPRMFLSLLLCSYTS